MKWFLQFLSLGSAILYTLLVIIDNRIPDGIADNTVASEAHSNQRHLSAWGPYLPNRSPGQDRQASTTTQPTHQQNASLAPKPYRLSPRQYSMTSLHQTTTVPGLGSGRRPCLLPAAHLSHQCRYLGKIRRRIWVFVIRGATVHSGPSVSAPNGSLLSGRYRIAADRSSSRAGSKF